ncbi:LacI family DNA-binding transcriptional regulator [Viridibacillus arvi]|uniref:LacI family DNA-binding transcriptional regulator n=1 Tax=Viridibacillus arvi TaxID=263475 RepID=UPI001D127ECA|nr:LacI family DNA-binding transcriptional regulator [Viridibacillus sp. JNUCC-6]
MVTRKEVAELAGVSEATVSRVFNNIGPIKPQTKMRVMQAAKQLDYHPNAIAQSFARSRSGNLGVLIPYMPKVHLFSTYYFSEILSGIGEQVREQGYDMVLTLLTPDESHDYSRLFRSRKVDACIILGSRDTVEQRASLQQLQDQGLPFCIVNQHFEGMQLNEVDADHVEGSYMAVRHLTEAGFRKIAFLNGSSEYSNSQDRLLGYKNAMKDAGLEMPPQLLLEGNYSRKSGYEVASKFWELRHEFDAVLVANDRMAIGLMQGLRERGWIAGLDFAVVGCDDSDAAMLSNPQLTSVSVPFFEMGKVATRELLVKVLGGEGGTTFQIKMPTKLIVRQSTMREHD